MNFILLNILLLGQVLASPMDLADQKMIEGQRIEAIKILNTQLAVEKNKKRISEILQKKKIFSEQFISSQSFQKYQEAKSYYDFSHYDDCSKEVDAIVLADQSNSFVLRLKAMCLLDASLLPEARNVLESAMQISNLDVPTRFLLIKMALLEKRVSDGFKQLDSLNFKEISKNPTYLENYNILKAKLLKDSGRSAEAIDLLLKDSEKNLDHIEVLFELANLYRAESATYWQARKIYSLFVNRCKRLDEKQLRAKKLDVLLQKAHLEIESLDKTLEVH